MKGLALGNLANMSCKKWYDVIQFKLAHFGVSLAHLMQSQNDSWLGLRGDNIFTMNDVYQGRLKGKTIKALTLDPQIINYFSLILQAKLLYSRTKKILIYSKLL